MHGIFALKLFGKINFCLKTIFIADLATLPRIEGEANREWSERMEENKFAEEGDGEEGRKGGGLSLTTLYQMDFGCCGV